MNQFKKIMNHAYQNSMVYQQKSVVLPEEVTPESIAVLPIITKQDATGRMPMETMDYIMERIPKEDIGIMQTSGSTGLCLPVVWHKNDYMRSLLPLWMLRKKYYDISPQDKMCFFYTIMEQEGKELPYFQERAKLGFSKCGLQENRMLSIYQMMMDYQPKWLSLQPSMAELLLEVADKYDLPRIESVTYIEFSGEMLFPELRQRVKEFFKCQIANQYGSYEVNSIAYECPEGHMHCMNSNVYVEIVDENQKLLQEEEEGEIIVTSLHNYMMPFVRYQIGDRGRMLRTCTCTCGNPNPILELTVGRSCDYIRTREGRKINPYIFVRAVERINNRMDGVIKQFKVVQKDYDDFQVVMRLDDNSVRQDVAGIFMSSIMEPELRGARFAFQYQEEFINEDGKKLRYFVNECK